MSVEESIVEVVEYGDPGTFVVRACLTADASGVLRSLDIVEDLLDDPTQLGQWADDRDGRWRGLAILNPFR